MKLDVAMTTGLELLKTDAILFGNQTDRLVNRSDATEEIENLASQIAVGIILSILILLAIVGNILVIVAILTDRSLAQTGNYLLVSLAIADTLVAVAVMSFAVLNDVTGRWYFGPIACRIWLSSDVMCSTASILNLCAISLDRYVLIRKPLHYEIWITRRRIVLTITAIWIMSALLSFVPIHLDWHRITSVPEDPNLTEHPTSPPVCVLSLNPLYATLSSAVSFYIPCTAMLFIYHRIHRCAREHVKSIKQSVAASKGDKRFFEHASVDIGRESKAVAPHTVKISDHKATATLGVIMGVFLVCWTPFFTVNVIGAFCPDCFHPLVYTIFSWLGYANSSMNPFIYGIFNRNFRIAFRRVLSSPRSLCNRKRNKQTAILRNQSSAALDNLTTASNSTKNSERPTNIPSVVGR